MLFDHFEERELDNLNFFTNEKDADGVRDTINAIAWARLSAVWDEVAWKGSFFGLFTIKTFYYRDLKGLWEALFGPMP